MHDDPIESLLRQAPQPTPPPDLLEQLRSDIRLPKRARAKRVDADLTHWWRKWLPLAAAVVIMVSGAGLVSGQMKSLATIQEENRVLQERAAALEGASQEDPEMRRLRLQNEELPRLRKDRQEVEQLREEITRVRAQLPEVTRLRNENVQLAASPALSRGTGRYEVFDSPDGDAVALAQKCKINLKQLGIAFQLWAGDHRDLYPSNFVEMKACFSENLKSPAILICPADRAHLVAQDWKGFTEQNMTYQLGPGASLITPGVVMFYCPVHNHLLMSDGSTVVLRPDQNVVLKDGKWYVVLVK